MTDDDFNEWVKRISKPSTWLLIEDEPDFVEMVSNVARRKHVMIISASSAEDGVKLLAEKPAQFDLILLDMRLKRGMDGMEVLRYMHRTQIDVPVVMLAGVITTDMVDEAKNLGIVAFVAKPVSDAMHRLDGLFRLLGIRDKTPSSELAGSADPFGGGLAKA